MNEKRMLLATFTKDKSFSLTRTLQKIGISFPEVKKDMVFVFENKDDHNLILTYDVEKNDNLKIKEEMGSTLQLHRKKQYNVFFTLNALNKVLAIENQEKKGEELNWKKYKNSLLITNNGELKTIPISFRGVEYLKNYRENN